MRDPVTSLFADALHVNHSHEAKLCAHHWNTKAKPIDLFEIYADPNSKLASAVHKRGGTVKRFTREDGDLSTFEAQVKLLRWLLLYRPKSVWMANECTPWCAWSRFNQGRSIQSFYKINRQRDDARTQLIFTKLVCKLQLSRGDHFCLENPATSELWQQDELSAVLRYTKEVVFDQCRFGLSQCHIQRLMSRSRNLLERKRRPIRFGIACWITSARVTTHIIKLLVSVE